MISPLAPLCPWLLRAYNHLLLIEDLTPSGQ